MKRKIRLLVMAVIMLCSFFGCVQNAAAVKDGFTGQPGLTQYEGHTYWFSPDGKKEMGWKLINGQDIYFRQKAENGAPKASMVTGFFKPYNRTYYFAENGALMRGWQKLNGHLYYFRQKGNLGIRGTMFTGKKKVGSHYYVFRKNGTVRTGWITYKGKQYYCNRNKTVGKTGRVYLGGWKTVQGEKYYFSKTGILQKNRWIGSKYYVGGDGKRLTGCVTPDGFVVDSKGVKVGLARGWVTVDGKKYYYDENGQRVTNTTIDGVYIGEDGVAERKASVLLIAGHGMGDSGATAKYGSKEYWEATYTREFAAMIEGYLKRAGSTLSVTMYDQNYDCFQVNRAYQQSLKDRDELKTEAEKKAWKPVIIGPLPDWNSYDYVLEVHFNATVEALKDSKGDGKYKGVGMYIYPGKKDYSIDRKIVEAISKTGIPVWGRGGGVFTSNLLNARTCFEKGVNYGLLETAFIDDKDDFQFYKKNKEAMAQAAALAIIAYFGA